MSSLRSEIVESQKVRSELFKWKLIIVSALGAAGLGFAGQDAPNAAFLVLPLIPLVCFYVDLLCRHVSLRISVIGHFIRLGFGGEDAAYEHYVTLARGTKPGEPNAFALEEWALDGSTIVLSLLVALGGVVLPQTVDIEDRVVSLGFASIQVETLTRWLFITSGLAGLVLAVVTRHRHRRRLEALGALGGAELLEKLRTIARSSGAAHDRSSG